MGCWITVVTFVLALLSALSYIPQKMDVEARARDPLSHTLRASATLPPNLHFDPKMAGIAMVTLRHPTTQRHKRRKDKITHFVTPISSLNNERLR